MLELPSYSYPRNLTYVWNKSKVFDVKRPVYRLVYNRQNMTTTTSLPENKRKGAIIMITKYKPRPKVINDKIYEIERVSDTATQALADMNIYNLANMLEDLESELITDDSLDLNDAERLFRLRDLRRILDEQEGKDVPHYVHVLGIRDQVFIPDDDILESAYARVLRAIETDYDDNEMHRLIELYETNEAVHSYFIMHNIYTLSDAIKMNGQSINVNRDNLSRRDITLNIIKRRAKENVFVQLDEDSAVFISHRIHDYYVMIKQYLRSQKN